MSSNPPRPPHNGKNSFDLLEALINRSKNAKKNDVLSLKANLTTILQARCLEWSSATASYQHLPLRTIPLWNQRQKRLPWKQQQGSHLWRQLRKPPQRRWRRCKSYLLNWRHHIICAQMDACLPALRSSRIFLLQSLIFLFSYVFRCLGSPGTNLWTGKLQKRWSEKVIWGRNICTF